MRRAALASGVAAVVIAVAFACTGSRRVTTARPSSAQLTAAGSPSLRTVDNAGWVDPGGRTRQMSQGAAPSPVGTGDPVAPTEHERPTGPPVPAPAPSAAAPTPASDDVTELVARASRALCDREIACGRIGPGKAYESEEACTAAKRERVRSVLDAASCTEIRGDHVSACLTAIRRAPCGPPSSVLAPPSACTDAALCGPSARD